MAMTPSAMTKCTGAVAQISRMLRWMPFQCRTFGPAVFHARHDAEHVLHAQCDASPMVGLDLWHRHDEVGRQHGAGQPQMIKASVGSPRWHFAQFIAVEINEADPLAAQLSLQAALSEHEVGVSLMARPLTDYDRFAPSLRNASAAAPTRRGFVFTSTPAMYSTRLGLRSTDFAHRSRWNSPRPARRSSTDVPSTVPRKEPPPANAVPACRVGAFLQGGDVRSPFLQQLTLPH